MHISKLHLQLAIKLFLVFVTVLILMSIFSLFFPLSTVVVWPLHLLFFMFLFPFMYYQVRKPIVLLLKTLQTDNPSHIQSLLKSKNDLGQLATLILQATHHKKELINEIAERKTFENALRESEERYRKLVDTSPDAIIMLDLNGIVLLSNQLAVGLFLSNDSDSLTGKSIYTFIPEEEEERISEMFHQIQQKERIESLESMMKKNGTSSLFSAEMSISLISNQTGEPGALICIIRDISDRKRVELEKSQLEEQFRSVYKMEVIGQLAGGIAHDFNNILGAISGYADIIKLRYTEDEKLNKYAQMILSASNRASELTRRLLTFSRKSKIIMDNFDTHNLLFEIAEILSHTIDKSISVITDFQAEHSIIIGDMAQVQSAIMNLALNARDAMPNGGELHISTKVVYLDQKLTIFHAYTIVPGNYLAIIIRDTGAGMDQSTLSHLFEPFFTTKDVGKGTGLGLASVYGTIKSHNGYIDVKSEPAKGSEFTLYIPVSLEKVTNSIKSANRFTKGKGTILIIDDEAIMRDAVREMLSWLGYAVNTCGDSNDAVRYYKYNYESIDLVILDMIMPGMNGKECFRQLKLINSKVKVIMATGYRVDEERRALLDEGIIDIIQKPFASAQLAQTVHDALMKII